MRWKIYYALGKTYSDYDGPVQDAPYDGVLAVAFEDLSSGSYNTGRRYRTNYDYYCYHPTFWSACNNIDSYLAQPGWRKVVRGLWVPDDDWHKLEASLDADDYLPVRTAQAPLARDG